MTGGSGRVFVPVPVLICTELRAAATASFALTHLVAGLFEAFFID
jgi:hypothetical protein